MKPALLAWFAARSLDPMNFLQDHGLVSDHAITLDQVAAVDLDLCTLAYWGGEFDRLHAL